MEKSEEKEEKDNNTFNEVKCSVSEFPYAGIFCPGGFLSQLPGEDVLKDKEDNVDDGLLTSPGLLKSLSLKNLESDVKGQSVKDQVTILRNPMKNELKLPQSKEEMITTYDLPHCESVLSIDHILEKILNSLEISDLLQCRLVSHRWLMFSQMTLEKKLTIKFVDKMLSVNKSLGLNPDRFEDSKSLDQFISVLRTNENESFRCRFPCVKFEFNGTPLNDSILHQFLLIHGSHIEELTFIDHSTERYDQLPSENQILLQLRNILYIHTPNLQVLNIGISCNISWKLNPLQRFSNDVLNKNDPEFNKIHEDCNKDLQNSSLKIVQLLYPVSAKIFETIVQLAPNLEEIKCDIFGFNKLLIFNPLNRIHLLKTLKVDVNAIINYEKLLDGCETLGVNLQLREVMICFSETVEYYNYSQESVERIVSVVNRILDSSWNCLEIIRWKGLAFLPGIKFPLIMPKVREFEFRSPGPGFSNICSSYSFFSSGSNFSATFPKLRCLRFSTRDSWANFGEFLVWLDLKIMPKISTVYLNGYSMLDAPFELISEIFPNARRFP